MFFLSPALIVPRAGMSMGQVMMSAFKPQEDRTGREGARVAIGRTRGGRYLRVVYVPDAKPASAFVITAYDLTGKPLVAYRRRRRRKGGR